MANKSLIEKGYGQIELNHVAFRRDGRIEAQCELPEGVDTLENGAVVAVDAMNREVVVGSAEALTANLPFALHYSAERIPEYENRLANFVLKKPELPRLGYLAVGDTFTTNNAEYDDTVHADLDALKAATDLYAIGGGAARWQLVAAAGIADHAGPVARARMTTMPDGQPAVELHVIKA